MPFMSGSPGMLLSSQASERPARGVVRVASSHRDGFQDRSLVRYPCVLDHFWQRLNDPIFRIVDIAKGMHEEVVHRLNVHCERSHVRAPTPLVSGVPDVVGMVALTSEYPRFRLAVAAVGAQAGGRRDGRNSKAGGVIARRAMAPAAALG
jgi:hypothetical protein